MECGRYYNKKMRKGKGWKVYILECVDGTLYTGSTNDLGKRLKDHNNSRFGAKYTRGRRPVGLVYQEECGTIGRARSRELQIKSWTRGRKFELVKKEKGLG